MADEYLTSDEVAERRREQHILEALRKLRDARGDVDPFALLYRAKKAWKRIPSNSLMQMVGRAVAQYRGSVTVESVAQAWAHRNERPRLSSTEKYRRRMEALEAASTPAPAAYRDDFFRFQHQRLATT